MEGSAEAKKLQFWQERSARTVQGQKVFFSTAKTETGRCVGRVSRQARVARLWECGEYAAERRGVAEERGNVKIW